MNNRRKNIPTVEEYKQDFPLSPCRNPKPNIPNLGEGALGKQCPRKGPQQKGQQVAGSGTGLGAILMGSLRTLFSPPSGVGGMALFALIITQPLANY